MITNTGGVHESIDFDVHNLQQEPQFSFEDAPIPPKKPFEPATVNLAVSGIVKQLSQFGIKDKLLNDIVSRVPQHLQVPGKMFLGYLTGTTPAKIDNSFYGEKAISELAKALQVKRNQYGQITGIGVGSDPYGWHNMVGGESPRNLTLGPDGKIRLKVNYVVEADHVEILKHGNQDMLPDSPLGKALVRLATYINGGGFGMVAPFCELTIGQMYANTPGYISGLTFTVMDEGTWETTFAKLPKYIQASCTFVYIGDRLPSSTQKHYELPWVGDEKYETEYNEALTELLGVDPNKLVDETIDKALDKVGL